MSGDIVASTQTRSRPTSSIFEGIRRDYFRSPGHCLVSVAFIALFALVGWTLVDWALINAVWSGPPDACRGSAGACWAVIVDRHRLILFGLYPYEEQWRSAVACAAIVLTIVLSCLPLFWSALRLVSLWCVGYASFYFLMKGGVFGLPVILETEWGGLALTMFVFSSTVLLGMPMAIGLALLRRSKLPVIARGVALWIDGLRSLPLVSILFTVAIILPFALPGFLITDQLYRVIFGSALFFGVYQAEIIRGGMQALPPGQEEAAQALGLNYWQTVSKIVLPQAFRYALPPTINQVVVAFMETSLIVILGFFEVTASGNAAFSSGGWNSAYIEVYIFVAFVYFIFTFSLSRYGAYLEKSLTSPSR